MVLRVSRSKRVAIYGVCKNEEKNVRRWYEHAKDADYILLLDTGSTDDTVSIARELGINVLEASISPWSENIAKNTAMSLLPENIDVCICLDLDQIIQTPNWKVALLKDTNFDIGVSTYLVPNGYKDTVERQELPHIHSRHNTFWFGYRPRLRFSGHDKLSPVVKKLPISVYHLPGDMERFSNREDLYVKSFLLEERMISLYSNAQYLMSTLCHIALSYFEAGNLIKFEEYYNKVNVLYNKDIIHLSHFTEYRPFSFVQLAKFLTLSSGHEDFLKKCLDNQHFVEIRTAFYLRLLVVEYLKYRKFNSLGSHDIPEKFQPFIDEVSKLNYEEIEYFLSNIEWGKSQMELAKAVVKELDNER